MRVLWVFEALSPQMVAVAAELDQQTDIELRIMTAGPLPHALQHLAATTVACRSKIDIRARSQIRQYLKDHVYDIAHAYTSRNMANLAGACWGLRNAPRLVGYRGTIDRLSPWDPANWLTFHHPRYARIVCVCQATQIALAASGVPTHKLQTVWEGCDARLIEPRPRSTLAEHGIPAGAFVVGSVANARRVKGLDILLQAALELAELRDIYWLLVGRIVDPHVSRLAADSRIADRVRLIGSQARGGGFCNLMDLYVAPSRKEGLSMGIMEAMSQGVCPIVSDVGGNPELIRDGIEGRVIPPEIPSRLSHAIRELKANPQLRDRFALAAQQRAAEVFSIAAWSHRLAECYRQLALNQQPAALPPRAAA